MGEAPQTDPAVVHMILELHRERLEEELAERRKALGDLETRLTDPAYREGSAPGTRMESPAAVAARER